MKHLLIADDDAVVRSTLARGLEASGYRVTAVADGFKALDAMRGQRFDLVVTDINMPGMDGIELLLRLVDEGEGVRVLAISGGGLFPKNELLIDARLLGAVDVLEKPFDMSALLERIEVALEGS